MAASATSPAPPSVCGCPTLAASLSLRLGWDSPPLLPAVNRLAWRMNRRKTVSVTPAMGASTVAGATSTFPRRTSAGTRASAGIWCSLGLSQSFFTVKPLPAMGILLAARSRANSPERTWASAAAEAQSFPLLAARRLLGCCCRCRCLRPIGLGILAAEALNAASRVHQALLAGEERVAVRANLQVNVSLVGRPGLKVVPAGAHDPHRGVLGMNLFLGHLFGQTFPAMIPLYGDWGGLAIAGPTAPGPWRSPPRPAAP